MKRMISAAVLVALTAYSVRAADPKPVEVPFELFKTKHMAINIKINGKGPYRMVFDTGAPVILVSSKMAKETGLYDPRNAPPFALFGAGGMAKSKKLEVGDAVLEDAQATIMDHPYIQAMSQAFGPVEGIVGYPFFARFKMTIDYQAQKLTLVPNGFEPGDANQALVGTVMAAMEGKDRPPKVISPAGYWGFAVEKPTSDKDKDAGVVVKSVLADSPAAAGGLKAGDRLLTLDDRWTDTVVDAYLAASLVKPGTEVKLKVKRDGNEGGLTVKPAWGLSPGRQDADRGAGAAVRVRERSRSVELVGSLAERVLLRFGRPLGQEVHQGLVLPDQG